MQSAYRAESGTWGVGQMSKHPVLFASPVEFMSAIDVHRDMRVLQNGAPWFGLSSRQLVGSIPIIEDRYETVGVLALVSFVLSPSTCKHEGCHET